MTQDLFAWAYIGAGMGVDVAYLCLHDPKQASILDDGHPIWILVFMGLLWPLVLVCFFVRWLRG